MKTGVHPPRASLLGLPAEIRNEIYRLSVVDVHPIQLKPDNERGTQPGLLRCCRQIRHESLSIFLEENEFEVKIRKLKIEPQCDHWVWSAVLAKHKATIVLEGQCSWSNFKGWLKIFAEGRMRAGFVSDPTAGDAIIDACAHMFTIVRSMRGLPWKKIERALEACRSAMACAGAGSCVFDA